jgi:hypothetical protein
MEGNVPGLFLGVNTISVDCTVDIFQACRLMGRTIFDKFTLDVG